MIIEYIIGSFIQQYQGEAFKDQLEIAARDRISDMDTAETICPCVHAPTHPLCCVGNVDCMIMVISDHGDWIWTCNRQVSALATTWH